MLRIVASVAWLLAGAAPLAAQTFSIGEATFDFSNASLAPRDGAQKDFVAAFRKAKAAGDAAATGAHGAIADAVNRRGRASFRARKGAGADRPLLVMQRFTSTKKPCYNLVSLSGV